MSVNLDYLLHFDNNTSLPNRLLFREQFDHSLPPAEDGQQLNLLPVLLLELEDMGFEPSRLGNHYRELLLKELGQGLLRQVWGIITVTRISLTRLAILLSSPEPDHSTVDMLEQVAQVLEAVFERWKLSYTPKPSIGVAFYPCDGTDLNTLMSKAEYAMLDVRARGGNDFQFFTPDMIPFSKLFANSPKSLSYVGFTPAGPAPSSLVYRPQFDCATRRISGVEILGRPPAQDRQARNKAKPHLITVSELAGLPLPGNQTLEWLKKERGNRITVMVSAEEAVQPELGPKLVEILRKSNLEPYHLALELAEEALFKDLETVSRNLGELRALGFHLVLSNLEIGYTSLVYLDSRFRFDSIKINLGRLNKWFKHDRNVMKLLLTAIIQAAQKLGMRVLVCEVETAEDLRLLESLDCDRMQGPKLAGPLSAKKFEQLLGPAMLPAAR